MPYISKYARKTRAMRYMAPATESTSTPRLAAISKGSMTPTASRSITTMGEVKGNSVRNRTIPTVGLDTM